MLRSANYCPGSMGSLDNRGMAVQKAAAPSRPASMASLNNNKLVPLGKASLSRSESPTNAAARPNSRASWKTFNDDSGCRDIAAAMATVNRVMKNKGMAHQANELQTSMDEADKRTAQEAEQAAELEAQEAEKTAKSGKEQDRMIRKLKAGIKKGSLKALRKVIDDAVALGVSEELINEARAFLRLESHLQAALSSANLAEVRKMVEEVERGKALASYPKKPPFSLHQQLQYWSDRAGKFVDCFVTDVSSDSKIQINLKKKASHWYGLQEQKDKFRITDADIALAAPQVRIEDALILLDKADTLEYAMLSEDVDQINAAISVAEHEKALSELVGTAQTFLRETLKGSTEAAALRRSSVASAWNSAKNSILEALQAEAERVGVEGGGLGNLEKDLAIERVRVAFDSSNFCDLEEAIKQLASEDLDIPRMLIEEAQQGLQAIAAKHEELEEAIRMGDIDQIEEAVGQACEHFLPQELVQKAMDALQMAAALDRAMNSRNPEFLASTVSQAERDFPWWPLVHRASGVVVATVDLQEALCNDNVDAMRAALELVEEKFLPEVLVSKAKMSMMLDTAIKSQDPVLLASTLSRAQRECVENPLVKRAQGILSAVEAVQATLESGDIEAIKKVLSEAKANGVLSEMPVVQQALGMVNAADALNSANNASDPDSIEDAIRAAEANGVPASVVVEARSALARKRQQHAADSLQALMSGRDGGASREEAIKNAKAHGVPAELVDKARLEFATEALQAAMNGNDVEAIENAIRSAEENGVDATVVDKYKRELEDDRKNKEESQKVEALRQKNDKFIAGLLIIQPTDIGAMRQAITEGEALGLEQEVVPVRKALEEELALRLRRAQEERAKHAKLAGEFTSAKEAQDFGGGVLVAQWRAAVAEIAKPLIISEE